MQQCQEQPNKRAHRFSKYLNFTAALLLVSIFLALNLTILISSGVRIGGDSLRYLSGAEKLLQGLPLESSQKFYLGYVALIACCQRIGIGLSGVIAIQLILAALAAVALYDLGRKLHGHWTGLIAAGLFVGNPDIARWHAFILTDSLYISLVILVVWGVHTATRRKHYWYIIASLTLIAAALVRPNGWFLMAVSVPYLVSRVIRWKSLRWLAISGIPLTLILGAVAASRFHPASRHRPPVLAWSTGRTGIKEWNVSMPRAPEPVEGSWAEALGYVAGHPFASLRLACTRVAIELIHCRPFYSFKHNILLLLTLPFLYLLALIGLKLNSERPLTNFIILVIAVHLVVIAPTYSDWDGRYLLYILPLICLFSSSGMVSLIDLYLSGGTMKAKHGAKDVTDHRISE